MSYENVEAVSAQENIDCKIIEKIIEIRTVVPENLCYTCFQSCFDTTFTSAKEYAYSISTTLHSYAPYIFTFGAGCFIGTVANNKDYLVKSFKAIITILFSGAAIKAEIPDETINKFPFQNGMESSYSHMSEQVPIESFISATEYKSESSFPSSPVDHVYMHLHDQDINLDFTPH